MLRILWPTGRWRWFYRAGLIMFVVMMPLSVELTSQSWFCNSCHIMGTYYHSWQTSIHKDVDCVQCHIAPGLTNFVAAKLNGAGQVVDDLLARTSTKPSASVSDFACTRSGCHDIEEVRRTPAKNGRYFFNHSKHLNLEYAGLELKCTSCHSHVSGQKHFEVHTNICITCHLSTPGAALPALQVVGLDHPGATRPAEAALAGWQGDKQAPTDCKTCHEAPKQTLTYRGVEVKHDEYLSYGAGCESCHRGVTAKPKLIDHGDCFSCHDFGIERMTTVTELHRRHEHGHHKVECFSCHGVTRHGPSAMAMRLDQIDCQACHSNQHAIQRQTYNSTDQIAHVPQEGGSVSPMFMAHVDCTGCHVSDKPLKSKPESGAVVATATAKSCDPCHKAGLGEQMIPLWQTNTRDLYAAVSKLAPADATGLSPQQQKLVAEARRLLETVRLDGSWGVHNPRYTQSLLEEARDKFLAANQPAADPGGGP